MALLQFLLWNMALLHMFTGSMALRHVICTFGSAAFAFAATHFASHTFARLGLRLGMAAVVFRAMPMTAPPPEYTPSGGYRPAGLRRALEGARLPAGCCFSAHCLRGGILEQSVIWVVIVEGHADLC